MEIKKKRCDIPTRQTPHEEQYKEQTFVDTFDQRWRRSFRLRGFLLWHPVNLRNLKDQERSH